MIDFRGKTKRPENHGKGFDDGRVFQLQRNGGLDRNTQKPQGGKIERKRDAAVIAEGSDRLQKRSPIHFQGRDRQLKPLGDIDRNPLLDRLRSRGGFVPRILQTWGGRLCRQIFGRADGLFDRRPFGRRKLGRFLRNRRGDQFVGRSNTRLRGLLFGNRLRSFLFRFLLNRFRNGRFGNRLFGRKRNRRPGIARFDVARLRSHRLRNARGFFRNDGFRSRG